MTSSGCGFCCPDRGLSRVTHSRLGPRPPGAAPNLGWPGSRRWPRWPCWREAVVRGCVCGSVIPGAGPGAPVAISSTLPNGAEASEEARQLLWGPLPFSWGARPGLSALPRSPFHPEPPASGPLPAAGWAWRAACPGAPGRRAWRTEWSSWPAQAHVLSAGRDTCSVTPLLSQRGIHTEDHLPKRVMF